MEQYWIFVVSEYSNYNNGSIKDILITLNEEQKWKIGNKTLFKSYLKKGDKIIFYIAGVGNKYFIAKSELNSGFINIEDPISGFVLLSNIKFFKNPVFIKPLLKKLRFVKYKNNYGISLQNGIVKISKQDYTRILKKVYP